MSALLKFSIKPLIGHDILTCTVNNYTDTKNITADFLLLWASGNTYYSCQHLYLAQ